MYGLRTPRTAPTNGPHHESRLVWSQLLAASVATPNGSRVATGGMNINATSIVIVTGGIASLLGAAAWLLRAKSRRPQPYDPEWLVQAAKKQRPNDDRLHAALGQCTAALSVTSFYIGFVDSTRPNQPGSRWQFSRNILLEDTECGDVVLDVLQSGEIGGVELLSRLLESDE